LPWKKNQKKKKKKQETRPEAQRKSPKSDSPTNMQQESGVFTMGLGQRHSKLSDQYLLRECPSESAHAGGKRKKPQRDLLKWKNQFIFSSENHFQVSNFSSHSPAQWGILAAGNEFC